MKYEMPYTNSYTKKALLLRYAIRKLRSFSRQDLLNFLCFYNPCPHLETESCGMDRVCKRCKEYVL